MDVTTALTIVIPEEFHNKINTIRKEHDRAYARWMPHINLMFPFVNKNQFNEIKEKLSNSLKDIEKFEMDLCEIGYFKQGKKATVHIKPRDDSMLQKLFSIVRKTLPDIPLKHDTFTPHLTIGQFPKGTIEEKIKELKEWLGDGIKFTLDSIYLINRHETDKSVPFIINKKVLLGS